MIDYHLHLWPHGEKPLEPTIAELADYCEQAAGEGVKEIAVTEHFFRFVQADSVVGGFWEAEPDARLRRDVARYWQTHQGADLDRYVEVALAAQAEGLPIRVGLEVDYYPGRMDKVGSLLAGYPFDVLLGSVHWLGGWMFDDLDSEVAMAEWDRRGVDEVWRAYTRALEELAATRSCDVLAHPDLAKVTGRRPAATAELYAAMAEAAAAADMAAEVSSAGWRKPVEEAYPAPALLSEFFARRVPVTTASDAHRRSDVAHRHRDLVALARSAGYRELASFSRRVRRSVPLEAQ